MHTIYYGCRPNKGFLVDPRWRIALNDLASGLKSTYCADSEVLINTRRLCFGYCTETGSSASVLHPQYSGPLKWADSEG